MIISAHRKMKLGPESEILDPVLEWLCQEKRDFDGELWAGHSVPLGAGLPDLVVAKFTEDIFDLVDLTNTDLAILAYLRNVRRSTAATILLHTGITARVLDGCLDKLSGNRLINTTGEYFAINKRMREPLPHVFTCEAKVDKWKHALRQAQRNRLFSNVSYLAMPENIANRILRTTEFQSRGIGLMAIENAEVSVLRQSDNQPPRLWPYYYKLAQLIALSPGT